MKELQGKKWYLVSELSKMLDIPKSFIISHSIYTKSYDNNLNSINFDFDSMRKP